MTNSRKFSRRQALRLATAAGVLPLVHMRTAGAAGKLTLGFYDHWVPRGNEVLRQQVGRWAEKHKVDVLVDFITIQGNKLVLTAATEDEAGAGHDVLALPLWETQNHARKLEPVDDVVTTLEGKYGKLDSLFYYIGQVNGHWMAVPSSPQSVYQVPCGRIDYFKQYCGVDLQATYPAKPVHTALADEWTYETYLRCAELCAKAGKPFGIGLSTTQDSVDITGSFCLAYGVEFVNAKGEIVVRSDNTRRMLEYMKKLVPFYPPNTYSFDNATDNRMLISDQTALIYNPPSAWAVALRDAPQVAEKCWTFPAPAGPAGRFSPFDPTFWGLWSFSRNKTAAKELLVYLSEREQVHERCNVVEGFDIPPFDSMLDFDIWERAGPPVGTVYNYPLRPSHNAKRSITGYPAPPQIAVQIYNQALPCNMVAKVTQAGMSIEAAIAWAENELAGYMG
jgi:ABC-type glycerol-3-phosphate transport system substrate-binding protein